MNKKIKILILLLISAPLFANDTYFFLSGGTLTPDSESTSNVIMKSEIITFDIYDEYFDLTVKFEFYNPGQSEELIIGFPYFTEGQGSGTISEFQTWTNDHASNFRDLPISKKWSTSTGISNAYTREISFPSNQITRTTVQYRSTFGRSSPSDFIASYLFGTGSSWNDTIGEIKIVIRNHTERWIYDLKIGDIPQEKWNIQWNEDLEFIPVHIILIVPYSEKKNYIFLTIISLDYYET